DRILHADFLQQNHFLSIPLIPFRIYLSLKLLYHSVFEEGNVKRKCPRRFKLKSKYFRLSAITRNWLPLVANFGGSKRSQVFTDIGRISQTNDTHVISMFISFKVKHLIHH
ncbi:MAG: hypothetical protein WBB02_10325, partial [Saprospiraceae bacterium]